MCEGLPSPGEHNLLFAFTLNFLIISILSSSGEEVKVKNGKRRTRAHARALAIRVRLWNCEVAAVN